MGNGGSKIVSTSLWLYTTSSVNDNCTYIIIKLSNVISFSSSARESMTDECRRHLFLNIFNLFQESKTKLRWTRNLRQRVPKIGDSGLAFFILLRHSGSLSTAGNRAQSVTLDWGVNTSAFVTTKNMKTQKVILSCERTNFIAGEYLMRLTQTLAVLLFYGKQGRHFRGKHKRNWKKTHLCGWQFRFLGKIDFRSHCNEFLETGVTCISFPRFMPVGINCFFICREENTMRWCVLMKIECKLIL